MKERVYTFGEQGNLIGIITESESSVPDDVGVILLNAGLVHRIGPFRMNVTLARSIAARTKHHVFRFDISGLGDSERLNTGVDRDEQIIGDIKQALDFFSRKTGQNKFIVIGLCTGADHAHKITVADERVTGAVLLDGYGYPTIKYYLNKYGKKILNPIKWFKKIKKITNSRNNTGAESGVESYYWKLPPKDIFRNDLQSLINREVKMFYVYSGGVTDYFNYKEQLADSFKGMQLDKYIQFEYFPEADHTYSFSGHRDKLIGVILNWIEARF